MNSNSCIETPAAPEWLHKLEDRREKLTRGKLGHELGAGAPCDECGDACPGLDLHFWRKVCRNCKCRKEKHRCNDDDLSGWAQFEILGQIRSKPAFIKIKALAGQSVQLEWVPPNAELDLVSEYMDKLGTTHIPVAGSDAAQKRKQQLEYQVPPHDLDAALCDNLTESETSQLQQYVQKIRESCVGQGNVVRIGTLTHGKVGHINSRIKPEYAQVMASLNEIPVNDPILAELLSTEKLAKAILTTTPPREMEVLMACSQPKVKGFETAELASLVHNGPIYDKCLATLKNKNFDVTADPRLGPIADFRKEYLRNPNLKSKVDKDLSEKPEFAEQTTPIKKKLPELAFNSPLPLKQPLQARFGAPMRQDTPMRKVNFGGVSRIIYDCGLPANVDYEKDAVFANIINSVPLKNASEQLRRGVSPDPVIISASPLPPDFVDECALSRPVKQQLQALRVDTQTLQSALLNGPFYDCLFSTLKERNVDYAKCRLLMPLEQLRSKLLADKPFFEEVRDFVSQIPNSASVIYANPQHAVMSALKGSNSNDSGFDSKPTTPNSAYADDVQAHSGRFAAIPGIVDMNMYPYVEPNAQLSNYMEKMNLSSPQTVSNENAAKPVPTLTCLDCTQPINFGDVAVKAERAGADIAWHPECFKCYTCHELLADLVYFFHGGQVYCGRDLAIKLKIPRCKACDELIFTKEYTAAESATFHIKHFCCYQCDLPLAGRQYIPDEKSNMPLCLQCYEEYFAAACQRCRRPIEAAGQGVVWGDVHWHADCFLCAGNGCAKSLIGGRFCVKENMPFCSPACVRSIIK